MECQSRRQDRIGDSHRGGVTAIKKYHDEAFEAIQLALTQDEQGHRDNAITFYLTGLKSLERGLAVPSNGVECTGEHWDHARSMQKKMRKTLQQMKSRVESLELEIAGASRRDGSYSQHRVHQLEADAALGDSILSDLESPPSYAESEANAEEVLCIGQGVQIYFLNSHGHVSAPSSPGPLRIFRFLNQETTDNPLQPPAFIQVDDWVYPLIPNQSPALKSLDGSYLFPDVNSPEPNSYIGLILSPDVPRIQREMLEDMLTSLAAMRVQRPERPSMTGRPTARTTASTLLPQSSTQARPPNATAATPQASPEVVPLNTNQTNQNKAVVVPLDTRQNKQPRSALDDSDEEEEDEKNLSQWSQTISKGLSIGASGLSSGLVKGASVLSVWVQKGAGKLREQITPVDKPVEIDSKYQKGAEYAKKATGVAVTVSKYVVDVVCDVSKKIAHDVGPVVRREGEKLLPESWQSSNGESNDTIDGVIHVAASGFKGIGTIFLGLEQAAKILAKNVSEATVETVDYKYGQEAAKVTSDGLAAGVNVGLTYTAYRQLGLKAIAKRAATDTGAAAVNDYRTEASKAKKEENGLSKNSNDTQYSSSYGGVQMSKLKHLDDT